MNCFGDFQPGRDFLVASLHKTIQAAFPSVRIHNERNGGNVFFVAGRQETLQRIRPLALDQVHPALRTEVQAAFARLVDTNPENGIILTDDYNPVEVHDAANREEIRRYLAASIRSF